MTGTVGGHAIGLGNAALMADLAVTLGELDGGADALRRDGATALFLAADGKRAGAIADPFKPTPGPPSTRCGRTASRSSC